MQFIEWFTGVSPDGGSGVLESSLVYLVGATFSLGVWWKYWKRSTLKGASRSGVTAL
jgi:hypothetical protein